MTNKKPILTLAIMLLAIQAISGFIGFYTSPSPMNPHIMVWYNTLIKSPLTPPGFVFGIVWPVLYGLMTLAAWLVWRKGGSLKLFWAHLVLNFAWSFVFFAEHYLLASQIIIVVILAMVATMAHRFYAQNKMAGLLLLPYIAWLCFASYLNGFILLAN